LFIAGESGSADTVRDPRGFAVKFYTDEGNWDLTGNNTPIFFIRDPLLVRNTVHTRSIKSLVPVLTVYVLTVFVVSVLHPLSEEESADSPEGSGYGLGLLGFAS